MPESALEQPLYTLPQSISRAVFPKIFTLLILSTIFYIGILLNIALLEMTPDQETTVKLISLIILVFIVALGIYLTLRRAHYPYQFYHNRVALGKKEAFYSNIETITSHQDLADHVFKTHSLRVGNGFILRHISNQVDIQTYLQQLVNYSNQH